MKSFADFIATYSRHGHHLALDGLDYACNL